MPLNLRLFFRSYFLKEWKQFTRNTYVNEPNNFLIFLYIYIIFYSQFLENQLREPMAWPKLQHGTELRLCQDFFLPTPNIEPRIGRTPVEKLCNSDAFSETNLWICTTPPLNTLNTAFLENYMYYEVVKLRKLCFWGWWGGSVVSWSEKNFKK